VPQKQIKNRLQKVIFQGLILVLSAEEEETDQGFKHKWGFKFLLTCYSLYNIVFEFV
jgi:hypothetical protein